MALTTMIRFANVEYYVKQSFSSDAAPALVFEIVEHADLALPAIGDRGSCTSCCIRDAIAVEQRRVLTAAIITTTFVREAELQRCALGMTDLETVVIEHPVSSSRPDIAARVEQIVVQASRIWLGRP